MKQLNPLSITHTDNQNSANTKPRGILHNEFVLSAYLIGALALGLVACSKEKPKPVTSNSMPTPVTAPAPPAPASAVAEAATPTPVIAKKKGTHKRPDKVTYKNDAYAISFQYPRRYALKTGDEAIVDWFGVQPVGMNFVQPGGVSVAAVELPRGSFPGTDYRDAFFTVNVNRHLSEAQCSQFSVVEEHSVDEESVAPGMVNIGGQAFTETTTFAGKTSEQSYARYYHRFENGVCYEVALGVETAGYGVVDGLNAVDRDDVFAKLEPMLASVKIEAAANATPEAPVAAATAAPAQEVEQNGAH